MKKLLFLLILAGGAAGGWWWWQEQQRLTHTTGPRKPVLAKLDKGDVTEKVSATGKVMPREKILVSTDVPLGIVKALNPDAEPGKEVKAGTWLIRLEDDVAQAKVKQAEAAVDAAKAARDLAVAKKESALVGVDVAKIRSAAAESEFKKQMAILGPNAPEGQKKAAEDKLKEAAQGVKFAESEVSAAESAIKTAEANVKAAEAGVTLVKKGVEMMTIHAPRDGVVLEKKVLLGQPVSPQNSPLFIMMPPGNDWEIYALVSESDVAKVQKDQTVEFTAEAYAGKNVRYRGKVLKKDLTPTQLATGAAAIGLGLSGPTNFGVTISVIHDPTLDKEFQLISGMTANVDVLVNSVKDKLRVPKAATQYQPASLSPEDRERMDAGSREQWQAIWVWTPAQRAELVLIKTGVDDGSFMEVKEVQTGPNVPQLQPGVEVVIEDPPPEEPSSGFPFFGGGKKPINIPIR